MELAAWARAVYLFEMINRRALVLVPLLAFGLPALAYIEALTSFKGVLQESDVIARGVIDAVSLEKKVVILRVRITPAYLLISRPTGLELLDMEAFVIPQYWNSRGGKPFARM